MNMKSIISAILLIALFACQNARKPSSVYEKSIEAWHKERIENLKNKSIWLKLSGLFWLKPGENSFGSDKSNDLIFPEEFPKFAGKFVVDSNVVKVVLNNNSQISIDSVKLSEAELKADISGSPTTMSYKSFKWFLIIRGDKFGIRMTDDNHQQLKEFTDIQRFEIDSTWRIEADYIQYSPAKVVEIPSVIGTVETDTCFGSIHFKKDGKEFKLEPIGKSGGLFAVFADETNGVETSGAGRFLVIDDSVKNGKVVVDFNKSYNTPCAFSKFATCPLPTRDNYLYIKVTAGEKNYHSKWH